MILYSLFLVSPHSTHLFIAQSDVVGIHRFRLSGTRMHCSTDISKRRFSEQSRNGFGLEMSRSTQIVN